MMARGRFNENNSVDVLEREIRRFFYRVYDEFPFCYELRTTKNSRESSNKPQNNVNIDSFNE